MNRAALAALYASALVLAYLGGEWRERAPSGQKVTFSRTYTQAGGQAEDDGPGVCDGAQAVAHGVVDVVGHRSGFMFVDHAGHISIDTAPQELSAVDFNACFKACLPAGAAMFGTDWERCDRGCAPALGFPAFGGAPPVRQRP